MSACWHSGEPRASRHCGSRPLRARQVRPRHQFQAEFAFDVDDVSYFLSTIDLHRGDAPGMSRARKQLFIATSAITSDAADYSGCRAIGPACPGSGSTRDRLIANLLVYDVLHAAKARASMPPSARRPFWVFLDELQTYEGPNLPALLEQSAR